MECAEKIAQGSNFINKVYIGFRLCNNLRNENTFPYYTSDVGQPAIGSKLNF